MTPYRLGQTAQRPWGRWQVLRVTENMVVKKLTIEPGRATSLQRHRHRSEWWLVLSGRAEARVGTHHHYLIAGANMEVPAGQVHQLGNPDAERAVILEIQTGTVLAEEDIERLEDTSAGRAKGDEQ